MKLAFIAGLATGYVLGTRAGKQRYEQIKTQAEKVWENPTVKSKVDDVTEQVKAKAPAVKSATGSAATKAAHKVGASGEDKDLPDTLHRGEDGQLHADTTGFGPGGERLP